MPLHVSGTIMLIIRRSKLYYTASGIVTLCRWSLYSHPTRIWYNLSHHLSPKRTEESIRKFRNALCYNSNWIVGIHGMNTPYIYSRNRRWYTSILYISNNYHCRTNRNYNLQMTCNTIRNQNDIQSSLLMSTRICIPIHNRRYHRCGISKLINRHCITWYLLRSSTPPLCPINRSSICSYRRIFSMIPVIHRTYHKPRVTKGSTCCYVCRGKSNLLPTTLLRTNWNQWPTGGFNPPHEISKFLQNRAKLNPIVKTVKKLLNLGRQHPKIFGKKAVKF